MASGSIISRSGLGLMQVHVINIQLNIVLRPHTHWSGWDEGACVKILALIIE